MVRVLSNHPRARVNLHCGNFDISHITADDIKVLILVKGLHNAQDSAALAKLLDKLDQDETWGNDAAAADTRLNLQDAINIATSLKSLSSEKLMVSTNSSQSEVMALEKKSSKKLPKVFGQQREKPPRMPCPFWAGRHWSRVCEYKEKFCATCVKKEHKTNHCEAAIAYEEMRKSKRYENLRQCLKVSGKPISTFFGTQLKLLLDFGSDWTIISASNWKIFGAPKLKNCEEQAVQ
jgi:hypothetical protein